jgi:hypothetical protein
VPLVVNPADFTVSAAPPFQTVEPGGAATYTATITASSGFTGAVTPTVTNLSTGMSASFDPPAVHGSGTSMLTVTTNSLTPIGLYRLNIAGTSGSSTDSDTVALAVQSACLISNNSRQDTAIVSQAGAFSAQFDVTPSASLIYGLVGVSSGASGFTAMVRFNPSGTIDAYDGGPHAFAALSNIPYAGGQTYHVRLELDVAANTYFAYVTPPGGSERLLARNYRFRYKTTVVDHWSAYAGPVTVCNFGVLSGDLKISAVDSVVSVKAGGTVNYGLANLSREAAILSVLGLPQGVSASFNPNPMPGSTLVTGFSGGPSTFPGGAGMSVTTSSTTPAGTYPLTIIGTNGDLVAFVNVTLVVTAP